MALFFFLEKYFLCARVASLYNGCTLVERSDGVEHDPVNNCSGLSVALLSLVEFEDWYFYLYTSIRRSFNIAHHILEGVTFATLFINTQ